jgi:hypothetical protein
MIHVLKINFLQLGIYMYISYFSPGNDISILFCFPQHEVLASSLVLVGAHRCIVLSVHHDIYNEFHLLDNLDRQVTYHVM